MKKITSEAIYDMAWGVATLVVIVILSIPLALAIFVALMLCLLPAAVEHQSWAHIVSSFNQVTPHGLFSFMEGLFVASWVVAFIAKTMVLPDEQNLVIREQKRRNILRLAAPQITQASHVKEPMFRQEG